MATKVYAPNQAFRGTVAGVAFEDGVGEFDPKKNAAAGRYFERHGYRVGKRVKDDEDERTVTADLNALEREATSPSPDARDHAKPTPIGTPLRDAAVDPKPEDFLAPINAGKADPHGPRVVAPEIHHAGPKGLKPGDVHVDDTPAQERDEKALAKSVLVEGEEHPSVEEGEKVDRGLLGMSDPGSVESGKEGAKAEQVPAKSATADAWREYAIAHGMDAEEAADSTRAELIERFGAKS